MGVMERMSMLSYRSGNLFSFGHRTRFSNGIPPTHIEHETQLSQCLICLASLASLGGANRLTFAQDNPNGRLDNTFSQALSVEAIRVREAADSRYQLDFGWVDLSQPSQSVFHIALLLKPITLGIVLPVVQFIRCETDRETERQVKSPRIPASSNKSPADEKPDWFNHCEVAIQLIDKSSQSPVLDVSYPLSRWTWTNWARRVAQASCTAEMELTSFKPLRIKGIGSKLESRLWDRPNSEDAMDVC